MGFISVFRLSYLLCFVFLLDVFAFLCFLCFFVRPPWLVTAPIVTGAPVVKKLLGDDGLGANGITGVIGLELGGATYAGAVRSIAASKLLDGLRGP